MSRFQIHDINSFAVWLDKERILRKISLIQNHHTFIPGYTHFNKKPDHVYWIESMERSHLERGFAEIAQHLTTFPDGKIGTGRSFEKIPAGIKGANSFGICIEHLGNFDKGGDEMTEAHKKTIVSLNALLLEKFNLEASVQTIVYHHWYDLNTGVRWIDAPMEIRQEAHANKTCPGTNFFGGNTIESCERVFLPLVIDDVPPELHGL